MVKIEAYCDDTNKQKFIFQEIFKLEITINTGFSIYERCDLWNSIQYQFKSKEQAKMEIDEQVLNEILSQRNVANIKSLYSSKAKKHNLSLNKQISTTKKDIVNLAKKLNRRQSAKQSILESSAQKWLWKQQKLFVWITIYYSEVKFLQLNSFGQKDFIVLSKLFPLKNPQFLRYQYYLAFCIDRDLRVTWDQQEIKIFEKILKEHKEHQTYYHWKKVSFLLFRESSGCYFKSAESCRNRWENHSNPNLNKNVWSIDEDYKLLSSMSLHGSKWAKIARTCFQGRTQHMIKNRYRCLCKKFNLNHLSFEAATEMIMKNLINNSQMTIKEESLSQNCSQTQLQTVKGQEESDMKQQQDFYSKELIISKPFEQIKFYQSNNLTIDEILSLSRSQEVHIQFHQYEEQWMDRLMNGIQFFNPDILNEGQYF